MHSECIFPPNAVVIEHAAYYTVAAHTYVIHVLACLEFYCVVLCSVVCVCKYVHMNACVCMYVRMVVRYTVIYIHT